MSDTKHVVLIHGGFSRGEQLAPARIAFEERGYTAHTPTLRHHELPSKEGGLKIASLSLGDYTDDLVAFVDSLDSPPLLIGHSMGALVAQLVAVRTRQAGLVAACPAPAAGIFGITPTGLRAVLPHLLRPRHWTKPWRPPTFEQFRRWIANKQTEDIAREIYDGFVCESGRYPSGTAACGAEAFEGLRLSILRRSGTPVLVIGGEATFFVPYESRARDRSAGIGTAAPSRFLGSDHMVFSGPALPVTMGHIYDWIARNQVLDIA